ncbi:MAG: hypothetical protein GY823_13790, partial [Flavobacteriaceae bacterium]|nr:hypothetical protein [Flavobacteriaceae bacterium]
IRLNTLAAKNTTALSNAKKEREALNDIQKGTTKQDEENTQTVQALVEALTKQAAALGKTKRQIDLETASLIDNNAEAVAAINAAYDRIDAEKALQEEQKKEIAQTKASQVAKAKAAKAEKAARDKTIATIVNAYKRESNTLIKQTETINQEYERRKKAIDDYVKYIGSSNEQTKAAYLNLQQWRKAQIESETAEILDAYVRRETMRQQIEKGQVKQLGGDDGGIG